MLISNSSNHLSSSTNFLDIHKFPPNFPSTERPTQITKLKLSKDTINYIIQNTQLLNRLGITIDYNSKLQKNYEIPLELPNTAQKFSSNMDTT